MVCRGACSSISRSLSMGSPTTTKSTTENTDPWAGQQPYLLDAFKRSQDLLNSQEGTKPYAAMTPEQIANYQTMIAFGNGAGGSGDALNWMQNSRDSLYGIAGQ